MLFAASRRMMAAEMGAAAPVCSHGHATGAAVAAVGVAAAAAIAAPFATYVWTLALFGFAHVAVEFRYVDERFGGRLGRGAGSACAALLLVVVGQRVAILAGIEAAPPLLVEGVALAVAPLLAVGVAWRRAPGAALTLAILAGVLGVGVALAPLETLVLFAVAHNLTPIGFVAERLRGRARRRALAWCALAFGVVPGLLASGAWRALLPVDGWLATGLASAGPGSAQLGVFVPLAWCGDGCAAVDLFRAAAFLQCMHYAVVLTVLPPLGGGRFAARSLMVWPRRFGRVIVVVGAGFALHFVVAFADARSAYGVLAAAHAWVEVPVLALAWLGFASGSEASRR